MKEHTPALFLNLIEKGILFRYLKFKGKALKPQAMTLEVTQNCIARCIMCNIWKNKNHTPELTTGLWLEMLSSHFFSDLRELDITGGEPYLKTDLAALLTGICLLKKTFLKSLRSIAVTTNGLLTEDVLNTTKMVLPILKRAGVELVIVCAMDAVGKTHDRIRNHKNAWEKVNLTVEGLMKLRQEHGNLIIGLKTTVLPMNIPELKKIAHYAGARMLFTIISPCIITPGRYLNAEKKGLFEFTDEEKKELIRFYRGKQFKWSIHADALADFMETGKMKKPCTCGFNYFFVRSNGDMFLCPLINEKIGNITNFQAQDLFLSKPATGFRKRVGKRKQCLTCTEPGLERYALCYEGFYYLKHLFKTGLEHFSYIHRHMGLDKFD